MLFLERCWHRQTPWEQQETLWFGHISSDFFTGAMDMDVRSGIFTNIVDQMNTYVSLVPKAKQILADLNPRRVSYCALYSRNSRRHSRENRSVTQQNQNTKYSITQQQPKRYPIIFKIESADRLVYQGWYCRGSYVYILSWLPFDSGKHICIQHRPMRMGPKSTWRLDWLHFGSQDFIGAVLDIRLYWQVWSQR